MRYTWNYNASTNKYDVYVEGKYLTSFRTAKEARDYCEYRSMER